MDLSSMLNDGPEPNKKPSQATSPLTQRSAAPPSASHPGANGVAARPGQALALQTSVRGPPPQLSRESSGVTPVQTPYQSGGAYYPFPASSGGPPSQQYRTSESPYPATTPGARPPSHGHVYPQPSPSAPPYPAGPPGFQPRSSATVSVSPTPSSHHSQTTPHSIRQSPLSVVAQQPLAHHAYAPPQNHSYPMHVSQPSTPLGPPSVNYHRGPTRNSHQEALASPYHQRTLSGARSSASPAQHHPSIGNLVESPGNTRDSVHHLRGTSDYVAQMDRERSLSVSPKTMVPPRPSSLSSRHSSQHDFSNVSARNSLQGSRQESSGHPPIPRPSSNSTSQTSIAPPPAIPVNNVRHAAPADNVSPAQQTIQHHSHRVEMSHLLTPANSIAGQDVPAHALSFGRSQNQQSAPSDGFVKPSPKLQTNGHGAVMDQGPGSEVAAISESRKRVAEADAISEPPLKRGKVMRRHVVRPIWARLKPTNPRYKANEHQPLNSALGGFQSAKTTSSNSQQSTADASSVPNAAVRHEPPVNGQAIPVVGATVGDVPPWQQDPPLDADLMHCRRMLGQWEKTFKWNTPYPDMLRVVQDWLFQQLAGLKDVGHDPSEDTVEIEAKIGKIVRKHGADGERLQLPVMSATVLHPAYHDQIRFESQMEQHEHAAMNTFLNQAIQDSTRNPGRVPMQYNHPRETDTFRTLSAAGIQALPKAFQQRPLGRELKLRTTTDHKTNQITARIVKIHIADLHIFNPQGDYDCRITMNLEVNLLRPDLHPDDLIDPPTGANPAPPDRRKDRLSYKHLAYSVDLTRVDVNGLAPKYELELEVDAGLLRAQMDLMQRGESHAFGDVVAGFLDNATYLMRCRVPVT